MLLAAIAPVDWLPEVAFAPDHAPEAEQEVASVEDQVSIEAPPLVTDVGLAKSDTGDSVVAATSEPASGPPQAERPRPANRAANAKNARVLE